MPNKEEVGLAALTSKWYLFPDKLTIRNRERAMVRKLPRLEGLFMRVST